MQIPTTTDERLYYTDVKYYEVLLNSFFSPLIPEQNYQNVREQKKKAEMSNRHQ